MDQRQSKFVAVNAAKEVTFEHDGEFVKIKYLPITRLFRDEAFERAAIEFKLQYGNREKDGGFLPSVFINTLARRIIKEWSIPVPLPEGWDMLTDNDLVDRILKEIGIDAALMALKGQTGEVDKAKNS